MRRDDFGELAAGIIFRTQILHANAVSINSCFSPLVFWLLLQKYALSSSTDYNNHVLKKNKYILVYI